MLSLLNFLESLLIIFFPIFFCYHSIRNVSTIKMNTIGGYKMTTKEKIEFIKQVTPHSDSEVEKIIKGMSDTSINRWYEIEKYRIDQELEEAVLTIYC
ncbi:predicted protein [Enterococcus faecalis CH188]|nr:predicted protein [Enterococcus faecalis CH188]